MWKEYAVWAAGLGLHRNESSGWREVRQVLPPTKPSVKAGLALTWPAGDPGLLTRWRRDLGNGGLGPSPAWLPHGPQSPLKNQEQLKREKKNPENIQIYNLLRYPDPS